MNMKIVYKQLESRWKGYAEKGYWGKVSLHAPAESSNPLRQCMQRLQWVSKQNEGES